jgi:hypothetical protein
MYHCLYVTFVYGDIKNGDIYRANLRIMLPRRDVIWAARYWIHGRMANLIFPKKKKKKKAKLPVHQYLHDDFNSHIDYEDPIFVGRYLKVGPRKSKEIIDIYL